MEGRVRVDGDVGYPYGIRAHIDPRSSPPTPDHEDFLVDLVLCSHLLTCLVLLDLKRDELTHQDIGQMDMYVRMYDELRRGPDDNPTVGIIFCAQKDDAVVRYSVLRGNGRLFVSRYKLVLPSEEELCREIQRERRFLEGRVRYGVESAEPFDPLPLCGLKSAGQAG